MPYYRLDPEIINSRWRFALKDGGAVKIIEDPETGLILAFTENNLPVENGMEKCTAKIFEKSARKIEKNKIASIENTPLPGLNKLEEFKNWKLEPYSNRQSNLGILTLRAGVFVLRIEFGGGRGDTICIGREITIPDNANRICFKCYASTSDKEPVSISAILTTGNERPWLETEQIEIPKGIWKEISFDISKFEKGKFTKITRLNLSIVTNVDSGHLLIDNLFFSC